MVFALGDVATATPEAASPSYDAPQQQQRPAGLPATAQVAFQEADYAAWNIWAAINKRPLLPFRCGRPRPVSGAVLGLLKGP